VKHFLGIKNAVICFDLKMLSELSPIYPHGVSLNASGPEIQVTAPTRLSTFLNKPKTPIHFLAAPTISLLGCF
jgi:hypothetical protein